MPLRMGTGRSQRYISIDASVIFMFFLLTFLILSKS